MVLCLYNFSIVCGFYNVPLKVSQVPFSVFMFRTLLVLSLEFEIFAQSDVSLIICLSAGLSWCNPLTKHHLSSFFSSKISILTFSGIKMCQFNMNLLVVAVGARREGCL